MSEEPPFNEDELKIVRNAKRTMMILGRIIRDKDVKKVITDPDLAGIHFTGSTATARCRWRAGWNRAGASMCSTSRRSRPSIQKISTNGNLFRVNFTMLN